MFSIYIFWKIKWWKIFHEKKIGFRNFSGGFVNFTTIWKKWSHDLWIIRIHFFYYSIRVRCAVFSFTQRTHEWRHTYRNEINEYRIVYAFGLSIAVNRILSGVLRRFIRSNMLSLRYSSPLSPAAATHIERDQSFDIWHNFSCRFIFKTAILLYETDEDVNNEHIVDKLIDELIFRHRICWCFIGKELLRDQFQWFILILWLIYNLSCHQLIIGHILRTLLSKGAVMFSDLKFSQGRKIIFHFFRQSNTIWTSILWGFFFLILFTA